MTALFLALAMLLPGGEGSDHAPTVHVTGWYEFVSPEVKPGWKYTATEYSFVIFPGESVKVAWNSSCRIRGVTHTAGAWDTQVCAP